MLSVDVAVLGFLDTDGPFSRVDRLGLVPAIAAEGKSAVCSLAEQDERSVRLTDDFSVQAKLDSKSVRESSPSLRPFR